MGDKYSLLRVEEEYEAPADHTENLREDLRMELNGAMENYLDQGGTVKQIILLAEEKKDYKPKILEVVSLNLDHHVDQLFEKI